MRQPWTDLFKPLIINTFSKSPQQAAKLSGAGILAPFPA